MSSNELITVNKIELLLTEYKNKQFGNLELTDYIIEHLLSLIGYNSETINIIRTEVDGCGCFYNLIDNYMHNKISEYNATNN